MKFLIQESQKKQDYSLIYRDEEYSFDTEPYYGTGFASILINDLQLEIDDEGKILYVWGFCPLFQYEDTEKEPSKYTTHDLIAVLDQSPIPGISYRVNEDSAWKIFINKKKGWICLGDPEVKNKRLIEFAPKCVATLDGDNLVAVWLHPKKFPNLEN